MLVKPEYRLQEGLFLGILGNRIGDVGSDCEAVNHARVEIDLVHGLHLFQNSFGFVAFLLWEDLVRLYEAPLAVFGSGFFRRLTCCCDGQWTLDSLDLLSGNETWMSKVSSINHALLHESNNVFRTKAVSHSADTLATVLLPHLGNGNFGDLVNTLRGVLRTPGHKVKALWPIQLHGISIKLIRHQDKIAIGSKLVGDKLGVYKFVADDVGAV